MNTPYRSLAPQRRYDDPPPTDWPCVCGCDGQPCSASVRGVHRPSFVAAFLVAALALAALLAHCAGAQTSHPWTTKADAALSAAAHALDAADAIAADRYLAEVNLHGVDLDAVDARYAPFARARRIGRAALIAAERAITAAVQAGDARTACEAVEALRSASLSLAQVGEAFAAAGVTNAAGIADVVAGLDVAIAAGPTCSGDL